MRARICVFLARKTRKCILLLHSCHKHNWAAELSAFAGLQEGNKRKLRSSHSLITTPPPETSKYHSHSEDYTEDPATTWTTLEMRAITVLHQWSQICGQLMKEEKGSIELDGNTKQSEENSPWSSTNRLEIMVLPLQPFKAPLEVGYGERGWETNY